MTKKAEKTEQNSKKAMLKISSDVAENTKKTVAELNKLREISPENEWGKQKNSSSKRVKNGKITSSVAKKLSLKSFTEAALLYFVENKIDPTLYNDATLKTEITRLRNQLFSFNVIHEQKILKEFSSLEATIETVKKSISTETIEGNNETQSFIAGLLEVMFQIFDIKGGEREKIVIEFKKKMIAFQEFNT